MIDIELSTILVRESNSQAGLGYLEWYPKHGVYHPGWDLNSGKGNEDLGLPIFCPCDGIVEYVSPREYNGGFGLHAVIYHEKLGLWSHYAHMNECCIKKGQKIKTGDKIGTIGKTGTEYAHLHFEVWSKKVYDLQIDRGVFKKDWEFYPAGYAKWQVDQMYIDPFNFLTECKKMSEEQNKINAQSVVSDWAKAGWQFCQKNGIIAKNSLPQKTITKEEMATILLRFYSVIDENFS